VTARRPAHLRQDSANSGKLVAPLILCALIVAVAVALTRDQPVSASGALVGIYTGHEVPVHPADNDGLPVELGVRFSVSTPGSIVAIRYYKSRANSGPHTGALWTANGHKLASVTFRHESTRGWQVAQLAKAVPLIPGVAYVASYHTTTGHYARQQWAFARGAVIGNKTIRGTAGTYRYGRSGFPTRTWHRSAYYVDALFRRAQPGDPTPTPAPTWSTPAPTPTVTPSPTPTTTTTPPIPAPTTTAAPTSESSSSTPAPTQTSGPPEACAAGGSYLWTHLDECGWPAAGNTGPVLSHCAGGQLAVNSGSTTRTIHVTQASSTISCQNITGCLSIEAPNVTVQNVKIACTSGRTGTNANGTSVIYVDDGASATISHVEINGMDGVHACIWHQGTSMTANAVNCHGINDGIFSWADTGYSQTTGDHFTIKDSYFHDFTTKTANGHIDGYQTEGAGNGLINHNTYYMTSDDQDSTDSAIAIWDGLKSSHDMTVSDNLIAGGGFAVYAEDYNPSEASPSGGHSVTNISFDGNKFSTVLFGCVGYYGVWYVRGNPSDQWNRSGNTVLETGADVDRGNPSYQGAPCT
jgi:hypothetical protein